MDLIVPRVTEVAIRLCDGKVEPAVAIEIGHRTGTVHKRRRYETSFYCIIRLGGERELLGVRRGTNYRGDQDRGWEGQSIKTHHSRTSPAIQAGELYPSTREVRGAVPKGVFRIVRARTNRVEVRYVSMRSIALCNAS
jgi:hypothetical protein